MATQTTSYSFDKPTIGGDTNNWGGFLNGNWDKIDDLLDGTSPVTGINITGGTANFGTLTVGTVSVVDLSSAQTLTNKTLTAPVITDQVVDNLVSASSGTITLDPDGTGAIALAAGGVTIEQDLIHAGDLDTFQRFTDDGWFLNTGGSTRINVNNSGFQIGGANARVVAIFDQDDMASDSDVALATQQSIKAYVDASATIGQQTIYVPASAFVPTTTNGALTIQTELATNDIMLDGLDFDTAVQQHAQFTVQMPKSWNAGTIVAQFIWSELKGNTGGVSWGIQARAFSDNDAADAALGTAQVVDDTVLAQNDIHISSESAAITVGGTPAKEDVVIFQVYRDVADPNDTMSGDATLLGVKLHYTTDQSTDD